MPGTVCSERLLALLGRFSGLRVVVLGDYVAEEFIYASVARVSREAPVLVLEYNSTEIAAGSAGSAANRIAALGARTWAFGCIGRDEAGSRLVEALDPRVDTSGLVRLPAYRTPVHTRIVAGGVQTVRQHVVRIDRRHARVPIGELRLRFESRLARVLERADAVLLWDHGSGLVRQALVATVRQHTHRRRVPIFVESRNRLDRFRAVTAAAPTESAVEEILGLTIGGDPTLLERAGRTMLDRTRMRAVVVTRGCRGMALFEAGRPTVHIPSCAPDAHRHTIDTGDIVISTMTHAVAGGASFEEAVRLASYADSLAVRNPDAAISRDDLRLAVVTHARGTRPRLPIASTRAAV